MLDRGRVYQPIELPDLQNLLDDAIRRDFVGLTDPSTKELLSKNPEIIDGIVAFCRALYSKVLGDEAVKSPHDMLKRMNQYFKLTETDRFSIRPQGGRLIEEQLSDVNCDVLGSNRALLMYLFDFSREEVAIALSRQHLDKMIDAFRAYTESSAPPASWNMRSISVNSAVPFFNFGDFLADVLRLRWPNKWFVQNVLPGLPEAWQQSFSDEVEKPQIYSKGDVLKHKPISVPCNLLFDHGANGPKDRVSRQRVDKVFFTQALGMPELPREDVPDLVKRARAGCESSARTLVRGHLKLVALFILCEFKSRVSLEELISSAMEGLVSAINEWKEEKGPFWPYAKIRIKGKVLRVCQENATVWTVVDREVQIYWQARRELRDSGNLDPTPEDVAYQVRDIASRRKRSQEWMMEFSPNDALGMQGVLNPSSLDAPASADPDSSPLGEIWNPLAGAEAEKLASKDLRDHQLRLLEIAMDEVSNSREKAAIRAQLCGHAKDVVPNGVIGSRFGVTREVIRRAGISGRKKVAAWLQENGHA